MKKDAKFEGLFQEGLEDLYDAEKQIAAALPKLIAASSSEELSGALSSHLEETKEHVSRLETIFERTAQEPSGKLCRPMEALLSEGERLISELQKSRVLDTALIAAARKVEHFEIAGYTSLSGIAEMLGQQDAFELLQTILEEETEADAGLGELSEIILSDESLSQKAELKEK
jgi:ferritin-like metal-binding protein YciE